MPTEWLLINQVTDELAMSRDFVYAAVRHSDPQKRIKSVRFGSRIMISREAVEDNISRARESALDHIEPPPLNEPVRRKRRKKPPKQVKLVYDVKNFDVRDVAEQLRRQMEGA